MRLAMCLVVLVACGDEGPDLTGVYAVESAVGAEPCGTDEPIEYAPYVHFEKREFLGNEFFAYDGCADAQAAICTPIGGVIGGFFEPIKGGWLGYQSSSSGSSGECLLGVVEQTAILDGRSLVIEVHHYEESVPLDEVECFPEEAERRGPTMPCVEHSLVAATRI
jgi:hypothetical protein